MNQHSTVGVTLLKIASVYMVVGLLGGLAVAITKQYGFATVHSHASLAGWVALALTGLVYLVLPHCATTGWATAHVWLHNLGLPLMLGSLTLNVAGVGSAEPLVALGSVLVLLGLLAFSGKRVPARDAPVVSGRRRERPSDAVAAGRGRDEGWPWASRWA